MKKTEWKIPEYCPNCHTELVASVIGFITEKGVLKPYVVCMRCGSKIELEGVDENGDE